MANAAERITEVLSLLANHPNGLSAAEVAEPLSISRAASSRLLGLMAGASLAERDPSTQKYALGLDLWLTGAAALKRLHVIEVSLLPMAEAVRKHGKPLFLGVNRGSETFFIRHVDLIRDFPIVTPMAGKISILESAIGKAILAFDSPARVETVLRQPLLAGMGNGRQEDGYLQEIERVRERGYALNREDGRAVRVAIGVPIIDHTGYAVAGLAVNPGPNPSGDYSRDPALAIVRDVADAISRYLGHATLTAV